MEAETIAPTDGRKSPIFSMVVSFLITAFIVGGGVYAYQNNKATQQRADLQSQIDSLNSQLQEAKKAEATPLSSPASQAGVSPAPTANWKIYTNAAYGLSFMYPPTWKVQDDSAAGGDITVADTEKTYVVEGSTVEPIVIQRQKTLPVLRSILT